MDDKLIQLAAQHLCTIRGLDPETVRESAEREIRAYLEIQLALRRAEKEIDWEERHKPQPPMFCPPV
jgi:hypothetical protein